MASTSPIAAGIPVEGLLLQVGNGGSPEIFTTVANVTDFTEPLTGEVVDVTNVGDKWRRRIATLLDMGKIKFKVFWVMTETTHFNNSSGGGAVRGLRELFVQQILADWKVIYNDGNNSADQFPAYVTSFNVTGKTGGVWEADIELSNNGAPTLV